MGRSRRRRSRSAAGVTTARHGSVKLPLDLVQRTSLAGAVVLPTLLDCSRVFFAQSLVVVGRTVEDSRHEITLGRYEIRETPEQLGEALAEEVEW